MSWVELFVVLGVCHMVGDFVLQTDGQAEHKRGGLGRERPARRALAAHLATYMLAFVPALVWIGVTDGSGTALASAAAIAVPHAIQDDGRLLGRYMTAVKGLQAGRNQLVAVLTDQALHAVALLVLALVVGS